MLLSVSFHCVYRSSLNAVVLNMRTYLSSSFIYSKEYRDCGNIRKITHDHGNNSNSIATHMRNKILQPCIFSLWFKKYYI